MSLLYGLAAVLFLWWLSRMFTGANPAILALMLKRVGGVALLGLAALLMFRGRIDMALIAGGAGAWLLGWSAGFPGIGRLGGPRASPSPGKISRVRSAMIEMELDHDTGDMNGGVLAGSLAGRTLASLSEPELQALYRECAAGDPDGLRLLQAYLDRRFPGWRKDTDGDQDTGSGGSRNAGTMPEEEAYQILGLEPGASVDEIKRAHRALMMKIHPDQGGSAYLASRVNAAKDVLLSRHR